MTRRTEQFETLIDQAPFGACLVDAQFRILQVNTMARRFFRDAPKLVGHDFHEIAHLLTGVPQAEEMLIRSRHTMRTGESYRAAEPVPRRNADGGGLEWYEWRIDPIEISGGERGIAFFFRDVTDEVTVQRAVAEVTTNSDRQRRLYETIISSTPDLVYAFDLEYRFTFVNHALLRMWGRSLEDSLGKTLLEIGYEPWHAEMHEREIDQVIATKESIRGEVGFRHAALGPRVYDYIFVPVLNEAGDVESIVGTTRDITERRQNEIERERLLREVEAEQAQLAELFEHTPSFMAMLSGPEHVFVRANTRYLQLVGHRDILGRPVREAIPESVGQGFPRLLDQVYATGEPHRGTDVRLELNDPSDPDGTSERWLDFVYQPIRAADGTVEGILVQGVDLTDRKRAELAVRESEDRFRNLADNIAQLAWMADSDGAIHWYNRRWFEYTGTSIEEMRGWGWTRVHDPEYVDAVVAKFTAHIREGRSWEDTFPLRSATGEYRWFLSRAVPIRDESGEVVRWFGTNTDITDQIALENALKEADRRKDEFLATLSHELRNPLAPIRLAGQLVGSLKNDPVRLEEVSKIITRQTAHMARLIDDLLDVSRITSGKIELRAESLDLGALVARIARTFQIECRTRDLQVMPELPGTPLIIHGDPLRISQVMDNLLNNASKFTDPGGRIRILVREEAGEAVVRVSDTGIGIEPEDLERIFEMFAQVGSPGRTTQGGIGIGLSLTHSLVQLHGGTVTAWSEGPGQGSEFTVRLPLAAGTSTPRSGDRVRSVGRGQAGGVARDGMPVPTVLAVGGENGALRGVATALRDGGYEVVVADSGLDALEKAGIHEPEIVLLDTGMPGIDGDEIARRIRRLPQRQEALLVALIDRDQEWDGLAARETDFDVHLTKPVQPEALERLLTELRR